jgi:hypothetical protein
MRATVFTIFVLVSIHALECTPTTVKPRYVVPYCKDAKSKEHCEQAAMRSRTVPKAQYNTKGYTCKWKGSIRKECAATEVIVDFIQPDPSKVTRGSLECKAVTDKPTCSSSFGTGSGDTAVVCYWLSNKCHSHMIEFPYEQLPAGAIHPKPEDKKTVSKCYQASDIPCEQRMASGTTAKSGKVCAACKTEKLGSKESCGVDEASPFTFCE